MNELSLFTGVGGGVLGTKSLGWNSVGYVEFNNYCQQVIAQRIKDGCLDEAPIFGDINEFVESGAAKKYQGFVDVVTAGFPCQPFSHAGKQQGKADKRNMWPATIQCIRDVRPRYAFLENVPGLLNSGYFGEILSSLAQAGFDARWVVLGADDVGAPHRRKRLWILAYPQSKHRDVGNDHPGIGVEGEQVPESGNSGGENDVADTRYPEPQGWNQAAEGQQPGARGPAWRESAPCSDVADSDNIGFGRWPSQARWEKRESVKGHSGGDVADTNSEPRPEGQPLRASGELSTESEGLRGRQDQGQTGEVVRGCGEDVADTPAIGLSGALEREGSANQRWGKLAQVSIERGGSVSNTGQWPTEPNLGRVAHGVASRVDRLKAIGNGQVPRVAATAWRILSGSL